MLRLSLWKRSNRYIDEAEFGSNLMSISIKSTIPKPMESHSFKLPKVPVYEQTSLVQHLL